MPPFELRATRMYYVHAYFAAIVVSNTGIRGPRTPSSVEMAVDASDALGLNGKSLPRPPLLA